MTQYLVIAAAAFIAGAINSIAGGGTLISFPALMYIGVSPVMANATNTVAIWPGSFAGVLGFREDIKKLPGWLLWLVIPSLLGGIAGAMILLRTPEKTFARIVPLLILGATLLLAAQELISRRLNRFISATHGKPSRGWIIFAFTFQFFVSVYGGYFGAGMGILMLAALGLIGMQDLHQMNGLKNLLAICLNGVAAIYFTLQGAVVWRDVFIMAVASILGGFAGARLAHRLGRKFVRGAVVVIGLTMTVVLFLKR
ncbi:MAG TPA: sulfite exporter TauE/SafE family protein [Thermoanaerobaculia bacterium]|jgi:hypothetical protein|nr:sulfite exporter TauE/SafE family protein [Thermoanaerobaculia bacterium]